MIGLCRSVCLFSLVVCAAAGFADTTITVLHTNDLHARVEPTVIRAKAYGGYARQATLIQQYRKSDPNVILLNGGDTFQGTLYFNVYEGLADLAAMNAMAYDAMAVGNHEFDRGPKPLGTFAKNARFPLLAANLDVTDEPELKGHIHPYTIVQAGSERIGVVGAITPDLHDISSPGPNVKLKELVPAVQKAVDELQAQKIDKIIMVSHCGFGLEKSVAGMVRGLDMVVGGHSHTLLGDVSREGWPRGGGDYPTVVKGVDGNTVLVVQAWEWGKVLGRIKVTFDDKGAVKSWADASPVPVDETIAEDPFVKSLVEAFQKPIAKLRDERLAETKVNIERGQPMGSLIADSMLAATAKQNTVIALMNPGGVRAAIEAGPITYGQAIAVQPFGNTLVVLELTGTEIKAAIEQLAARDQLLWVSKGSSYRHSRSAPEGSKISDLVIAGSPVDPAKTYRVVVNNFMASGGDALYVLRDAKGFRYDTGVNDLDALIEYLKANNPITAVPERRVSS
jgi:5'-nucleotidase/UDP-sugar diphosphatase